MLPTAVASMMHRHFGRDFSDVRVHADSQAGRAALQMQAAAYTKGSDIYFAPGFYRPDTTDGRALIAHELAHVEQQRRGEFPVNRSGPTLTGSIAEREQELENEADQAASRLSTMSNFEVRGRASPEGLYKSPLDGSSTAIAVALRAGFHGLVTWVVENTDTQQDETIRFLVAQMDRLSGVHDLHLPLNVVPHLESLYEEFSSQLPPWVPAPAVSFASRQVQPAALVAAVPVAAILALLAVMILLVYLISQPRVRRDIARAARSIERAISDGLRFDRGPVIPRPNTRPTPTTNGVPRAAPRARPRTRPERFRPRPPPFGPDVDGDIDERGSECAYSVVQQQSGRYPCHADFAASISGVTREVRITTPEGVSRDFDAMDHGGGLHEVKTGYRWLPFIRDESRRQNTARAFLEQATVQVFIAERCGHTLDWHFNEEPPASFFGRMGGDTSLLRQPLPVPVWYRPFPCDHDG